MIGGQHRDRVLGLGRLACHGAPPEGLSTPSGGLLLFSGIYGESTVTDTGREIQGREVDIYIANDAEAKRFGRRK
jgi:hypothetical protein